MSAIALQDIRRRAGVSVGYEQQEQTSNTLNVKHVLHTDLLALVPSVRALAAVMLFKEYTARSTPQGAQNSQCLHLK